MLTSGDSRDDQPHPHGSDAAIDDDYLAAVVGPRWESHYQAVFARFGFSPGRRPRLSWNWSAALAPFWLYYRGRLGANVTFFLLFVFLVWVFGVLIGALAPPLTSRGVLLAVAAAYAAVSLLQGAVGDWIVYQRTLWRLRRSS